MLKTTLYTLWIFTLAAAPVASMAPGGEESCEASAQTLMDEIETGRKEVIESDADVVVTMNDGSRKSLPEADEPAEPRETWLGKSPSDKNALVTLEDAMTLARDGKEEECLQLVSDVRDMVTTGETEALPDDEAVPGESPGN